MNSHKENHPESAVRSLQRGQNMVNAVPALKLVFAGIRQNTGLDFNESLIVK